MTMVSSVIMDSPSTSILSIMIFLSGTSGCMSSGLNRTNPFIDGKENNPSGVVTPQGWQPPLNSLVLKPSILLQCMYDGILVESWAYASNSFFFTRNKPWLVVIQNRSNVSSRMQWADWRYCFSSSGKWVFVRPWSKKNPSSYV